MPKDLSLRAKMVLGGTIILLVPVVVIGAVAYVKSSRASEDAARMQFVQIAQSLAGMIRINLEKDLRLLSAIADDPAIARQIALQKKTVVRERLSESYPMFQADYEGLAIFDKDGIIFCDGVDAGREGIVIADRQYFREARQGKVGISPIILSKATGEPIFALCVPILSPEKEFAGGVLGLVKVDFLVNFISSIKIGKTGYAFMLDQNGIVVAHPEKSVVLTFDIHRNAGLESLANELEGRSRGSAEYTYSGKRKFGGFARIELAGWTVAVTQDKKEILSLVRSNMNYVLLTIGSLIVLTVVAVLVLSRRLSAPVQTTLDVLNRSLEQVMEATQAGVWEANLTTEQNLLSAQWFAMLGYEAEAKRVSLKELAGYIHPEDWPAVEDFFENYVSSGGHGPYELELRLRRKDGSWCWILSKARAVERDEKGIPTRIIVLDINIQNLKDAQIRLAQSEARFRALFRMAPLPLAEVTPDELIGMNDRFSRTLGYTREDIPTIESWWEKAYPNPDYRAQVVETWQSDVDQALRDGTDVRSGEYRVTAKDGTIRDMIIGASVIGDRMLVSFFDITGRKREETARLESLELLRATFNATPDGILVVDDNMKVTQANRQLYEMWRIPEELRKTDEEAVLRKFALDQLEDPSGFRRMIERLYHTNIQDEYELVFKDGRVFECYSAPMTLNAREIGRVWVFRDISRQKRADAEKERLQGQLLQAQKMEAVGTLAGGVAHDFNNMLGAIIGYAELTMAKMPPEDPFRKNLDRILDAANRSANITRQLLAFARKQTIAPVVFDLNESVSTLLKMVRRLIGENIDLAWSPGPGPCTVKMDPAQLDQVLVNLCVNARDAIENVGKLAIETETVFIDERHCASQDDLAPGEYAMLAVRDDGCGMDAETLAHVFEPFFTTKAMGEGTGMGLATVYGIVRQNGGGIDVQSEAGKGTTFRIYIPLNRVESSDKPDAKARKIPVSRGETVLVVEDDPNLLEMSMMMLQTLGYEVLYAAVPNEAIRIAQETDGRIDMFVTDVVMPEMNGRELAARLREIRPGIRHLFMSGYTADVIVHEGLLDERMANADVHFIQKPFSLQDLAVKIREVLA